MSDDARRRWAPRARRAVGRRRSTPLPAAAEVVVDRRRHHGREHRLPPGRGGRRPTWSCSNRAPSARGRPRNRWAGSGPRSPTRTTSSSGCGACAAYETFADRFGIDIGLRQVGYLFLCRSEAELAAVEASVRLQNRLGCNSRMVSAGGGLRDQPDAGAGPAARRVVLAAGRLRRARPGGRGLRAGRRRSSGSGSASTPRSSSSPPTPTGGHQRPDPAGVRPGRHGDHHRRGLVDQAGRDARRAPAGRGRTPPGRLHPAAGRPHPTVPFTLDLSTTLYFHNYRNGLLLGISNLDEDPGFCREFSYGWTRAFDAAAAVVAPSLVGQPLVGGWAGLYENTPDHNAMIGKAAVPGVLYATGFSGHGFLQGPAVGEIVRDLYLDRDPFMDPTAFSADRFGTGALLNEVHII